MSLYGILRHVVAQETNHNLGESSSNGSLRLTACERSVSGDHSAIPVIDVSPLVARSGTDAVASEIAEACRDHGFFYVVGHGVDQGLIDQLDGLSHQFFARPLEAKLAIRMALGGRAWRGYFPIGAELTSGQPDGKEGLYFGAELPEDHPKVKTRTPLYGRNLFPDILGFREVVLDYMASLTALGHILMEGMALSLGLGQEIYWCFPKIKFGPSTPKVPKLWPLSSPVECLVESIMVLTTMPHRIPKSPLFPHPAILTRHQSNLLFSSHRL